MTSDQKQEGGDHSVNIQVGQVHVGLSLTEARQVAMDVYESNFLRLSSIARETATERAEELLDRFLAEMQMAGHSEVPGAQDPDFQYALFVAQREYARSGDDELASLLVKLLADRSREGQKQLLRIVLNESLSVAPKLTSDQIAVLGLVFILRYTTYLPVTNFDDLVSYVSRMVLPCAKAASRKATAYQHLAFTGCATVSAGSYDYAELWRQSYAGVLCKGFTADDVTAVGLDLAQVGKLLMNCLHDPARLQVNSLSDTVLDTQATKFGIDAGSAAKLKQLQNDRRMTAEEFKEKLRRALPEVTVLDEVWESTQVKNLSLTSVGIAIGHAHVQHVTNEQFDLSIWIQPEVLVTRREDGPDAA